MEEDYGVGVNSQDKVAHLGQELLKEELLLSFQSSHFIPLLSVEPFHSSPRLSLI